MDPRVAVATHHANLGEIKGKKGAKLVTPDDF